MAAKLKNIQIKFINFTTALVVGFTGLTGAVPLFMTQTAYATSSGDVWITAALPDPSVSEGNGEYVILHNNTGNNVNISGWTLDTDGQSDTFAAGTSIPANGSFKVCSGVQNAVPTPDCDVYKFTMGLSNTSDQTLTLTDNSTPAAQIDQVNYTASQVSKGVVINFHTGPTPLSSNSSVTGQDFDTWDNSPAFKGINVGFKTENFTHIDGIVVTLQKGGNDIVTNTASTALLGDINNQKDGFTQNGQLSAPFVVSGTLNDTYCQGGPCWSAGSHNWTANDQPDEATVTVTGTDQSGNVTKYAYLTNFTEPNGVTFASLFPANQPPTITFTDPTPADNTLVGDSFKVGFEANDDHGFKGIVVGLYDAAGGTYLRDCTMASNVASPQYTGTCTVNTTGLDTGNYTIEGRVQDSDGVFGAIAKRTVFIDRTPPEVSFTSPTPANDSYLNGNFTVSFNANDNYQLRNITVALYNTDGSLASSNFYSVSNVQVPDWTDTWNFDPSNLNDGTYVLKLRAQDMAGNYAIDATRTIHLDRTAPIVTVTPLSADGTLHGTANFTITVTGDHLDTSAMKSLWVYLYNVHDSTRQAGQNVDLSSGTGTFTVNTKDLADGTYTLDVANFKDLAGNNANNDPHDQYFYGYTIDNTVNTPTNGVYLNTNDFNFTWDGVIDASGPVTYQFQSSLNPSQVNGVLTTNLWHSDTLPSAMIHSSGAPDGTWYWQVRALDNLGNTSNWSSVWTVTLDTKAPDAPTIKTPTPRQWFKTTPILDSWTPVIDPSGIAKYQVAYRYDNDHSFSGSTCPGATIDGHNVYCRDVNGSTNSRNHVPAAWEQGGVTIWVRAIDNAGNASAWSKSVHYYYDHENPATDINVAGLNTNNATNSTFTVEGDAYDNLSLNRVYVQLVRHQDSKRYGGATINLIPNGINPNGVNAHWSQTYDIKALGLPDGTYSANVEVADMAGNSFDSGWTSSFTVDTTPPSITFGTPDGHLQKDLKIDAAMDDTGSNLTEYGFDITGPNGVHFSTANYSINQPALSLVDFDLCAAAHYGTCPSDLPTGVYTIRAKAYDAAGNRNISKTLTLNVDTSAPDGSFDVPTGFVNKTVDIKVDLTAIGAAGLGEQEVVLRDSNHVAVGNWQYDVKTGATRLVTGNGTFSYTGDDRSGTLTISFDTTSLNGTYYLRLFTHDQLDNGRSNIYGQLNIDNTAPTLTIDSVSSATSAPVTITGTTSDSTDTITVEVNGVTYNATVTGTAWSATVTDPLAVGKYTATVTDSDTLGNTAQDTASVVISPIVKPAAATGTGTGTGPTQTFTVTPANNSQVLGASTDTPNTTKDNEKTGGQIKGDQTTNQNTDGSSKNKTVNNSRAFLGLGWWWLLILAVILAFLWFLLGKRTETDDKKA